MKDPLGRSVVETPLDYFSLFILWRNIAFSEVDKHWFTVVYTGY